MMVVGWKSYDRALETAKRVSTNPTVRELSDGSFVAIGDVLAMRDGSFARVAYLPRRQSCDAAELEVVG